jgi:hypothetical protein
VSGGREVRENTNMGEAIDLARLSATPWVYVDEKVCAMIQGRTVRAIQRDRREGIGAPYKRVNGKCIRYKVADILQFLESQPSGRTPPLAERPQEKPARRRKLP